MASDTPDIPVEIDMETWSEINETPVTVKGCYEMVGSE